MTIAINCRVLNERRGGPFRFTFNLISELAKQDKINTYFLLLKSDFDFNFSLPKNFKKIIFSTKSRLLFDYWHIPRFSRKHKIDYFLFPKNTFSPFIRGKKIPIYHDIIYYEKNLNFKEFNFFDHLHHKLMIRYAAKRSFLNFSVSDFTSNRMKKLLKIPENKIKVIKEGVESSFKVIENQSKKAQLVSTYNLSIPFLFYSGSLSPRKNMLNVLKAFNLIKEKIPHNLYFTAGDSWKDNAILNFINKNDLTGRVKKLGYLSEEELVLMYNLADIYLYPSFYEGFGLPILEAQACGCPVITSDVSSCPEIAGNSAYLVNPYDINEISQGIILLLNDDKLQQNLIKKGIDNCQKYSWSKMAKEYLEILNKNYNSHPQ